MGFNVSISAIGEDFNFDCSKFINRNYYNFTTSYSLFGDKSVLIKGGEYFNLDLKPLADHVYYIADEMLESIKKKHSYEIDFILQLIRRFKFCIIKEPDFLNKVQFESKENINQRAYFINYTSSKRIIEDLDAIIDSIKCYKEEGEKRIFFSVG